MTIYLTIYLLSPISFVFSYANGTIFETPKSVIINELLKFLTESVDPPEPDIIDRFYVLNKLKNVPDKKEIHIIFDKFKKTSIKDFEHDLRGRDNTHYEIRKEGKRPLEFGLLLRSFVEFLIKNWSTNTFTNIIEGKIVKVNYEMCYIFESSAGIMKRTNDYNLCCCQEEADTKISFHICQMNIYYVILLANYKYLKDQVEIIINLSSGKKELYLNINKIFANVGEK